MMADFTLDQVERAMMEMWATVGLRPTVVHVPDEISGLAYRAIRRASAFHAMVPHRASYWHYLQKRGAR